MKEVSSCQENIDTEAINEKDKKKKKSWISCSAKRAFFAGEKCPVIMLTWKQSESIPNYTELIAQPFGPFAFIFSMDGPFR